MKEKNNFIARIKYLNDLPPPQIPPKLLKYDQKPDELAQSSKLITSLYTKTNVNPLVRINDDLGMELDLMKIPGVLDQMDDKYLYGFDNIKLEPKDRVLLRDPRVDRLTKTDISKVSFLRRTEYMSSATSSISSAGNGIVSNGNSNVFLKRKRISQKEEEEEVANDAARLDSKKLVRRIESTFDDLGTSGNNKNRIELFKHPTKKNLKAVKTWSLLPDTVAMDQKFFLVKLAGSAVLDKKERDSLCLETAIFRPVELEEDDWISFYSTDKNSSKELAKGLEQQLDEITEQNSDPTNNSFKFKRIRDYNMNNIQLASSLNELSLTFNDERGVAYYKPLQSKIELKRRRVNDFIKPLVKEHDIDQLNVTLKNPTAEEQQTKDKIRSDYDPIDFPEV
ncbi:related to RNA polymerase II-associated protein 1 [Saccharomycodes ludwigii]|uniref:Related to RNA polymerase II-associated protein 1 n=1 Tax=Saccharomycodes ludwigii TaxID=36035 RepID=A0A376B1S1_9ASCO|nr:hypothetical protein SCDLUD_003547 [Saccharomycodes ludwigii]KAH3900557.1 hypothetical protein SCDLUD_003547 [Saccharomycodes ludwigii]SSD58613.1 related to RNA polymerase II-associated protein 1 [Saccharomycodes ludwigii]